MTRERPRLARAAWTLVALVASGLVTWTYADYRSDIRDARARIAMGGIAMRFLALCMLLFVALAEAGESPAYGPSTTPEQLAQRWIFCRLTTARPGRTVRSPDITVYTSLMPQRGKPVADIAQAFSAFVEKTYGIQNHRADCGGTNTEAQAQQALDFWTTNKANPSQILVVKTGWTYQE
jgi:hypothetical protein